ncbi:MAG: hypothetical protein HZA54_10930, partial [Planctomycetes bacterium]|nr:hypothetical protein [Planctomycetota bacterium]
MIGALVAKELAIDTGSRRMAAVRTLTLGVALAWLVVGVARWSLATADPAAYPRYGRALFSGLAWTQLLCALFLGPALAVGAVGADRRKGTLGVRYLVGYSPAAVVCGKFLARVGALSLVVVSTLPIFLFVFAYGGVSTAEVVWVYGICLVTAAWGTAAGLLASVLLEDAQSALLAAFGLVAAYGGVPLALAQGASLGAELWVGPLAPLYNLLERGAVAGLPSALWSMAGQAAALALAAALLLPRFSVAGWRVGALLGGLGRLLDRLVPAFVPNSQALLDAEDVDDGFNPFTWREVYGRPGLGLRALAGLTVLAVLLMIASYAFFADSLSDRDFHTSFLMVLCGGGLLLAAALAGSSIAAEKESKALEVIYLHSVPSFRFVYGKYLGLFWMSLLFCVPALAHAVFWWLFGDLVLWVPLAVAFALPHAMAIAVAHGIYLSLLCRTEVRAMAAAVFAEIVLLAF